MGEDLAKVVAAAAEDGKERVSKGLLQEAARSEVLPDLWTDFPVI